MEGEDTPVVEPQQVDRKDECRLGDLRNGVLLPAAEVSDTFTRIVQRLVLGEPVPGFPRLLSLETYSYAARQRLEFVKRLYKEDHGIYASKEPPPIDSEVFVYSIEPDRTFRVYPKIRTQAKAVR